MRIDRTFSYTALPPTVDPSIRDAFQAMAKAVDQLTNQINHISFGQSFSDIISGAQVGNFNGKYLAGRVTAGANVAQRFFHNLEREPIGCLEVLTLPQKDSAGGAAVNVAAALAVTAFDSESITLVSSVNNKNFTLLVF